jgi:hypothetical protein
MATGLRGGTLARTGNVRPDWNDEVSESISVRTQLKSSPNLAEHCGEIMDRTVLLAARGNLAARFFGLPAAPVYDFARGFGVRDADY